MHVQLREHAERKSRQGRERHFDIVISDHRGAEESGPVLFVDQKLRRIPAGQFRPGDFGRVAQRFIVCFAAEFNTIAIH